MIKIILDGKSTGNQLKSRIPNPFPYPELRDIQTWAQIEGLDLDHGTVLLCMIASWTPQIMKHLIDLGWKAIFRVEEDGKVMMDPYDKNGVNLMPITPSSQPVHSVVGRRSS